MFNLLIFALLAMPRAAQCLVADSTAWPQATACRYSEQFYEEDAALMLRRTAPTRFRLMTSRYVSMVEAERGLQCAQTTTVSFDGHNYTQTGRSDDPGLMELVPTFSRFAGLTLIDSYDVLIFALVFLGTAIGYIGFCRLNWGRRMRWIGAAVFLCIAVAETRVADEYVFQVVPLIAAIPWLIYLGVRQSKIALPISAAALAFCCSFGSIVRSGSVVICLAFVLPLFIARYQIQKPLLPILLVLVSCVPSFFFARSLITRRNISLTRVGGRALTVDSHPLWHTLYIGLGFIPNSEVPEYRDGVGGDKVRSIDPTAPYTSAKYQSILKHEMWNLLKRRPFLVIGIFAAKAAIVFALMFILLLPAGRLIFAERSSFWLDISFLSAILMSGMNGVIAVPRASYLLTLVCLTFLYTFIKLCRVKVSPPLAASSDPEGLFEITG